MVVMRGWGQGQLTLRMARRERAVMAVLISSIAGVSGWCTDVRNVRNVSCRDYGFCVVGGICVKNVICML